jgi:hypothetical protein
MDPRYVAVVSATVILVLGTLGFLIRTFVRGWLMPACWCCGAHKVRKSKSDGFLDKAAGVILLRPFRCTGCRERFYAPLFMADRPSQKRAAKGTRPSRAQAPAHLPAGSLQTQNPA